MRSMGEERGERSFIEAKPGCPSSSHRFAAGPFFSPLARGEECKARSLNTSSPLHEEPQDLAILGRAAGLDLDFPDAGCQFCGAS